MDNSEDYEVGKVVKSFENSITSIVDYIDQNYISTYCMLREQPVINEKRLRILVRNFIQHISEQTGIPFDIDSISVDKREGRTQMDLPIREILELDLDDYDRPLLLYRHFRNLVEALFESFASLLHLFLDFVILLCHPLLDKHIGTITLLRIFIIN